MKKLTTIAFIVLAFSGLAQATIIVKYDFGDYPYETLDSAEGADHITASKFGYTGDGDTMYWGGSEGDAYAADGGWEAYENFFYFTVTIDAGWSLDVTSLQFDAETSVLYKPDYAKVTCVSDTETVVIETDIYIWDSEWKLGNTANDMLPTDLTGNVEFRIYAKGGLPTFNDPDYGGFFAVDNVILNGDMIPEPATICLLGLGALSLIRRKK